MPTHTRTATITSNALWVAFLVSFLAVHPVQSFTASHDSLGTFGIHPGGGSPPTQVSNHGVGHTSFLSTRLKMSTPGQEEDSNGSDDGDDDEEKDLNFYELLGADQDASRGELKKKYVMLARVSHPDAQIGGDADDSVDFQKIAEAWRTLGNPKSRRRYDRQLKAKAWGEAAQRITNESLENVAPSVSKFMDNLAVPFLRKTSATAYAVGKGIQTGLEAAEEILAEENADETATPAAEDAAAATSPKPETVKVQVEEQKVTPAAETTTQEAESLAKPVETTNGKTEITFPTNTSTASPSPEPKKTANVVATTLPSINATDAGIPDYKLNEKSQELEEQAINEEKKAQTIYDELHTVKEKRLFSSLQSDEYEPLTSCEAAEVLKKLSSNDTVSFVHRSSKKDKIEKEIASLRTTEQHFTKKLESYTEIDKEWNQWLTKQEDAKKTLDRNKQKEFEARQALDTAEKNVSKASTDVLAVTNKLRGVEQEVRRSAQEMDRVSTTLSRKQEKVRNALRRKTELMKGGITVQYVTVEEVKMLRRKETQLMGESKQIATMVAKLQSRADLLKQRAEALEQLKKK